MIGIYKITSPSGKVYIGQSWNIKRRISDHKRLRGMGQRRLHSSMVSYGVSSHIFEILHQLPNDIDQSVLDIYEQFYIDAYRDSGFILLNIKEGGNGYGKHSEETKAIIREKRKLQITSEETRKKMSSFFKTIPRTKQWIDKVAAKSKGRKQTDEQRKAKMKPILQFSLSGELIREWPCSREAAKALNTTESNICNNLTGRAKTAAGYKWEYL